VNLNSSYTQHAHATSKKLLEGLPHARKWGRGKARRERAKVENAEGKAWDAGTPLSLSHEAHPRHARLVRPFYALFASSHASIQAAYRSISSLSEVMGAA